MINRLVSALALALSLSACAGELELEPEPEPEEVVDLADGIYDLEWLCYADCEPGVRQPFSLLTITGVESDTGVRLRFWHPAEPVAGVGNTAMIDQVGCLSVHHSYRLCPALGAIEGAVVWVGYPGQALGGSWLVRAIPLKVGNGS